VRLNLQSTRCHYAFEFLKILLSKVASPLYGSPLKCLSLNEVLWLVHKIRSLTIGKPKSMSKEYAVLSPCGIWTIPRVEMNMEGVIWPNKDVLNQEVGTFNDSAELWAIDHHKRLDHSKELNNA
jgi:hypothetical protein